MSGPFAPPRGMPQRLPMGQTNKPMGADRVMQGGIPQPNPGAVRTQVANQMGIPPGQLAMKPGYTPPPVRTLPRVAPTPAPAPAPVPAPAPASISGPVPLPRPRPEAAQMLDTARQGAALAEAVRQRAPATYTMGWQTPQGASFADRFGGMQPPSVPATPVDPAAMGAARAQLAQMLAAARIAQAPKDVPKGGTSRSVSASPPSTSAQPPAAAAPPAAAPAPATPGGRFVPSQESNVYYQRDPNADDSGGKKGKGKDSKPPKPNEADKGHSLYYYQTLNVDPAEGKGAANSALMKLIARAKADPTTITREEDRLLAGAAKDVTAHKSLEESAIKKRFEEYAKGAPDASEPGSSTIQKKLPDRAAASVEQTIAAAAAPQWQGNRMPTQADVNMQQQAPLQFAQRFPAFQMPPPQATAEPDTEQVPEEAGED